MHWDGAGNAGNAGNGGNGGPPPTSSYNAPRAQDPAHAGYQGQIYRPPPMAATGAPPSGPPPSGYNAPPSYSAPPSGYNAPPSYSAPPSGLNAPPSYSAPPSGLNAPPSYSAPPLSLNAPPSYTAPTSSYNGAPPSSYNAPPSSYNAHPSLGYTVAHSGSGSSLPAFSPRSFPTAYPPSYINGNLGSNGSMGSNGNENSSPAESGMRRNVSSSSRIDPALMPRLDRPKTDVVYHTRSGGGRRNPPSCNSVYTAVDAGNCSPRLMRATMAAPPATKDLLLKTGLPFALLATPFASPQNGELPVPQVDLGPLPPRCSRCAGYVNPYVAWTDAGNSWVCNLCNMSNDVPSWYFCSLDGAGQRMDKASRPELQLGSVDFVVNQDYCVRELQEPVFVFAIDISHKAVANGVTIASLRAVQCALLRLQAMEAAFPQQDTTQGIAYGQGQEGKDGGGGVGGGFLSSLWSKTPPPPKEASVRKGPSRIRAAVITFDKNVQFYSVDPQSPDPVKILVSGAEDPLCPLPPHAWLHHVCDEARPLELLLTRIPDLIRAQAQEGEGQGDECCVGAALKAAQEGLEKVGGRIYMLTSSHATAGYGALSRGRERINMYGSGDEFSLYGYTSVVGSGGEINIAGAVASAATLVGSTSKVKQQLQQQKDEYRVACAPYLALTADCIRSMVSVSVIACVGEEQAEGGAFLDTALLGDTVLQTGGQMHVFSGCLGLEDNVYRLEQQLVHDVSQVAAAEAVAKLRTSVGVRVDRAVGGGVYSPIRGEVELCGVDTSTTLMFTLCHDSPLKEDEKVHMQLAVLHTTPDSRRVIRVLNLTTLASLKPSTIFRNSDIEAVVAALMKEAVERALTHPLDAPGGARAFLDGAVSSALLKYRITCSPGSPRGQLILPDSLKVLPVFTLAMLKHPSLHENRTGVSVSSPPCSPTQSLVTIGSGGMPSSSKLAFTPAYGSALSRVAVRGHERAHELRRMVGAPLVEIINSLYPRVYNLFSLLDAAALGDEGFNSGDSRDDHDTDYGNSGDRDSRDGSSMGQGLANEHTSGKSGASEDHTLTHILGRNAVGLQLDDTHTGTHSTSHSAQVAETLLSTLNPSSEVFEFDQVYLLDDRSTLYMHVGRAVPAAVIDELFETITTPQGRKDSVSFRTSSLLARRMCALVDLLRASNPHKADLKVLWAGLSSNDPLTIKFSSRLVEDSNLGLMSYVDYLCNLHTKIKDAQP